MGDQRSLAMSPFNRNYVSILYCFRVIASYLLKVAYFNLPHAFGAPLGGDPFKFRRDLWHPKTRVRGLSCSFVYNSAFSHFDTIRHVMDGRMDRQTDKQTNT